ncbi:hypothetical protein AAZX31_20G162800 [Glycine max]|uniref:Mitochondrial transcription termination factor family protein n=3 Tax=Glycine subgen. Soja TaxID=1462606 RepID=I1NHA9_SOYBN|nr:uncharacterized protein LOC100797265 isoform X1 [Glycine max]XP_028222909.1 uncharacterized protein LOC114403891 isoform X1 [Glycine soja]KAG4908058.1 hypothetical protein JHK86_056542 [Glycine max]KAG4910693.1 hypothetical protein JHK87_056809 [Glycine soja]KAG4919268.1 hypothetical protein JHK85_057549 [Glycine max]KAG5075346.1 hypothetical protein JHK84_056577 [Glycine max]KAH1036627.1 hypothetical protein GYH30_056192 [Glycine max]|eukprot:XP_003556199.1 uncharacterized protein LOC100797265 isoform X1 [Glycine max]
MDSLKFASLTLPPCSRRSGMLGKRLNSPLLIIDSSAQFCYCKTDLAAASSSIPLPNMRFSCRFSPSVAAETWTSNLSSKQWILHSTAQIENIITSNEDQSMWEACKQALSAFNFSDEEKDKILGKAFGLIHSPYWGEERSKEVPKLKTVNGVLDYLRSLNLSDDDLSILLKKFPEVLGCNLEEELKGNVKILEEQWSIKGNSLRKLLLRNPKVLGYNVDCKGDCIAQCTRCWARF